MAKAKCPNCGHLFDAFSNRQEKAKAIYDALTKPMTLRQLSIATGIPITKVREAIHRLKEGGLISYVDDTCGHPYIVERASAAGER